MPLCFCPVMSLKPPRGSAILLAVAFIRVALNQFLCQIPARFAYLSQKSDNSLLKKDEKMI
jgi:hypothetical protein